MSVGRTEPSGVAVTTIVDMLAFAGVIAEVLDPVVGGGALGVAVVFVVVCAITGTEQLRIRLTAKAAFKCSFIV